VTARVTSRGTPRFLGQVTSRGSIPNQTERIFLFSPVRLSGSEIEGAVATMEVDQSRTIPVVVIGGAPPRIGDLLVAVAAGGRWVAEAGGSGTSSLTCSPCAIPKRSLTLSWSNGLIGPGSTQLVFTPPGQWNSACTNQLLYALSCYGSLINLTVTYFLSGSCPTGQSQQCVSPGSDPFALYLDSYTCNPFYLHYTVTGAGCPVLWSNGYSSFAITE
jgi:hypothetical protein